MPPILRNGSFLFVLQNQPFYHAQLVPMMTISILGSFLARARGGLVWEEDVHARNVIAFFVWAWLSGAVPLGELLHEEALFGLTGRSTPRMLIPVWTLPLRHISSSLGMARPFTNKVKKRLENVQTLWWAELDRLHSMTHTHPPLSSS